VSRQLPLGVGVIGCGYWGPNLVRNFARSELTRVVAVCDVEIDRARKIGAWYGVDMVTSQARELILDPAVDLVCIATPSRWHHALAREAIAEGKHVLVMKPMTTSVDEAEELVDLAERQGVLLAVDHTFVYSAAVRKLHDIMATGELGQLYYIDSVRINLGAFQSDVNVIWDLAPHDISIIDYLLGGMMPTEVSAIAASHAGSRVENLAYLTMSYGESLIAHVHVNWLAPAKIRRTIVGGSRKMVVYDDVQPSEKVLVYDRGVTIDHETDPEQVYRQLVSYRTGDVRAPRLDDREALAVEADHIATAIRTGGRPDVDGHAGLRAVRVLAAAEQSARTRSAVRLGTPTETFVPLPVHALGGVATPANGAATTGEVTNGAPTNGRETNGAATTGAAGT
jgi:predicted dehydrogenase